MSDAELDALQQACDILLAKHIVPKLAPVFEEMMYQLWDAGDGASGQIDEDQCQAIADDHFKKNFVNFVEDFMGYYWDISRTAGIKSPNVVRQAISY
jgi:hypothetical protein